MFGIWYGKGPGVDRSGDALRHANFTGVSPKGGAIALAGDDHGARSSTAVNFSDTSFIAVGMPVLYPSNTQELIDFGLHGIAMSRFSGCWVGMKIVTDVAEGGGTVYVGPEFADDRQSRSARAILRAASAPRAIDMPLDAGGAALQPQAPGRAGLRARQWPQPHRGRRRERADRRRRGWQGVAGSVAGARQSGDVRTTARFRTCACSRSAWCGRSTLSSSATSPRGLDLIVVIEEKRPLLEDQIRSILYGAASTPSIVGKYFDGPAFDPAHGAPAIPNFGEATPELVAAVLVKALRRHNPDCGLSAPEAPAKALSNRPPPAAKPRILRRLPRTTARPACPRAAARLPASAATRWRCS